MMHTKIPNFQLDVLHFVRFANKVSFKLILFCLFDDEKCTIDRHRVCMNINDMTRLRDTKYEYQRYDQIKRHEI